MKKSFRIAAFQLLLPCWLVAQSYWHYSPEHRVIEKFAENNGKIYAGGFGFYYTYNSGDNWVSPSDFFRGETVECLAACQNTIFASSFMDDGVYRSTDDGRNWIMLSDSLQEENINTLAVFDNKVFAGVTGGLYVLSADGKYWKKLTPGRWWVFSVLKKGAEIYIGTQNGVFVSDDDGRNWRQMNKGMGEERVVCLELWNNRIFAGTEFKGIYLLSNDETWVQKNNGFTMLYIQDLCHGKSGVYAATSDGLFLSSDFGDHWKLIYPNDREKTRSYTNCRVNSVHISGRYILAGIEHQGVYRSPDNGLSWESANEGMIPKPDFRWDHFYQILIVAGIVILIFCVWILPVIYLVRMDGGRKIYFRNLTFGLLMLAGVTLYIINHPTHGFDFSNVIIGFFAVIIWMIWGLVLLIYVVANRKKMTNKKEPWQE